MEATIEAELVAEEEGKIYTAVDLFRLPVSDHHYNQCIPSHITSASSSSSFQVLRCKTIILLVCWVTCASLYYVLLLDQSELSEVNNQHLTLEQSSHLALSPDQGKYSLPGSLLGLLDHSGCAASRLRLRHPHLGEADVRQEEVVEYLKFLSPSYHLTIYAAHGQSRRSGRCASSCCSPEPA